MSSFLPRAPQLVHGSEESPTQPGSSAPGGCRQNESMTCTRALVKFSQGLEPLVCTVIYFPNPACLRALGGCESTWRRRGAAGGPAGGRQRARRGCFHEALSGRCRGAAQGVASAVGASLWAAARARVTQGTEHVLQPWSVIRAAAPARQGQEVRGHPKKGHESYPSGIAPSYLEIPHVGGPHAVPSAGCQAGEFLLPQATGTSLTSVGT